MPRARMLKPGFFLNEDLAELPPLVRLLYAGLWTIADREGRLEDRPKRIKNAVLPYDKLDVDAALNKLQELKFVVRYEEQGGRYVWIPAFLKHQHPHVNEPASTIPAPLMAGHIPPMDVVAPPISDALRRSLDPESLAVNGVLTTPLSPPARGAVSFDSRRRRRPRATQEPPRPEWERNGLTRDEFAESLRKYAADEGLICDQADEFVRRRLAQ